MARVTQYYKHHILIIFIIPPSSGKGKAVPLRAWTGLEGS